MDNYLQVENLYKTYPGGVQALRGISLTLQNGMFGLLGPNGAGKSTLMRTLATLQPSDSGSIFFNGINTLEHPQYLRQRLGFLPQEFGVYPGITAVELLDYIGILKGLIHHKQRRNQVEKLLAMTNLTAHRRQYVHTFSGGMLRRFGIAQALLGAPQIIIVDEPTAGLDPEERNRFLNLLSEIGQDRIVLLSTHIVEDVERLCQQLAIVHDGQLVAEGSPADLIQPLHGCLWQKRVTPAQVDSFVARYTVLQVLLIGGQPNVIIYHPTQPDSAFLPVSPTLEHAYFLTRQTPAKV
ncbi:MAG: ABC transporter ATP-binding protein [Lewinellaceae bacterium]|nr:ABC transporter ATP-binding protein [Lewinellaceae bacterium]